MSALKLIIQREYHAAVRTKAFLMTTILTPVAMIAFMLLPGYLVKSVKDSDIQDIYIIDRSGQYTALFESSENYTFIDITNTPDNANTTIGEMYALLTIDSDLSINPAAVTFFSEKQQPSKELISYINSVLTEAVKSQKIENYTSQMGIDVAIVDDINSILQSKEKIWVNTKRWIQDGEAADTIGETASYIGIGLTFFMFFFVMMYGSIVMQSVTEEKTNRIVEVIVSSTKPFNLMMGKIIAVALTGLTQLLLWGVIITVGMGIAFSIFGINAEMSPEEMQALTSPMMGNLDLNNLMSGTFAINWLKIFFCFIVYFVGGYLLYSSLFAMFGSAANDAQEAQQFIMPITIILFLAFYVGFAAANNPEGSLAFWGSVIPFTAPIVMMVRIPFEVPVWELALSVTLLYITAFLSIKMAGKIYRTGILMYGKKMTFGEIFKWLKYK